MPRCSFTFGQIEEILAAVHHIAPERRVAFQGRLKHFQRENFPTGQKPGKGKALKYGADHLFKMVIAMELVQSGMTPKLVVQIVEHNWSLLQTTTYLSTGSREERRAAGGDEEDWCWLIRPEAMRELTVEGIGEYDQYEAVMPAKTDDLGKYLGEGFGAATGSPWRTLVINAGSLVRGVLGVIDLKMNLASAGDIKADLMDLISDQQRAAEQAMASIDDTMKNWTPPPPKPLRERYPPAIIERAENLLANHRELLATIFPGGDVGEGVTVELSADDVRTLRDSGIMEIAAEGMFLTTIGALAVELSKEPYYG
ncbi:hypothetical protein GGR90_002746 [Sphingopyxis italica]|uniref:Uncharacterized protein n=1 Tax=Sphingopyxis italica TaxID=1129133 RepID=A0A7X5XSK4_9SPHN|nr:hypothetical protein [Sphingopyxis italica]NJB90552.1 hypothetical protein [Sphingopyxis italica]